MELPSERKNKFQWKRIMWIALLLSFGPILTGFAITGIDLVRTLDMMGTTADIPPEESAAALARSLRPAIIGAILSLPGFFLVLILIFRILRPR